MIECEILHYSEVTKMPDVVIYYGVNETPFGYCLIGFQDKNDQRIVCHLSFQDSSDENIECMMLRFPGAQFISESEETKRLVLNIFYEKDAKKVTHIPVLLKGTDFQLRVWEALTRIPLGQTTTYEKVAEAINHPKAVRAVAGALRANQIGYLIPCHRVVCKSGCNKYSWGAQRKLDIQDFEKKILQSIDS